MTAHVKGVLLVLAAAVFWSFGGLLIKFVDLFPDGDAGVRSGFAVAGARSAIAALVMWLYIRRVRTRSLRELWPGVLAYAGTVLFFVLATRTTTAANAILLQYTAPIYVALLSARLLGERITSIDWGAIALVLVGMALFFYDSLTSGGLLGNVFAVVSGIFFALCVITLRRGRHGSSMEIVLFGNVVTAAIGLPMLIGSAPGLDSVICLILLGVVQLGLGYILFVRGMERVTAIEGVLIPVIEPILNPIWVALFYEEFPSPLSLIGGLLVVVAVTARGVYKALYERAPAEASAS